MSSKGDTLKITARQKRLAGSEGARVLDKTLVEFYVFYHIDSVAGSHWGREREYPPKVVQNQLRHILNVN